MKKRTKLMVFIVKCDCCWINVQRHKKYSIQTLLIIIISVSFTSLLSSLRLLLLYLFKFFFFITFSSPSLNNTISLYNKRKGKKGKERGKGREKKGGGRKRKERTYYNGRPLRVKKDKIKKEKKSVKEKKKEKKERDVMWFVFIVI